MNTYIHQGLKVDEVTRPAAPHDLPCLRFCPLHKKDVDPSRPGTVQLVLRKKSIKVNVLRLWLGDLNHQIRLIKCVCSLPNS